MIVGNISAGSWGPANYLAYVKEYGFFDADAVVVVISSHDYADYPQFKPLDPNPHPTANPISALSEGITRYLPRYLPWRATKKNTMQQNGSPNPETVKLSLDALRSFIDMANHTGARVFVLQHWTKNEIAQGSPGVGNKMIAAICGETRVPCVQMNGLFQDSLEKGKEPFRDDIHINDIGQELLAKAIRQA